MRLKKSTRPAETTDAKPFELVGIDISEEIHQAGRYAVGRMMPSGLSLQLANFTASTFGSMRSPPAADTTDSTTNTISPTLPVPLRSSVGEGNGKSTYSTLTAFHVNRFITTPEISSIGIKLLTSFLLYR